MERANVIVRGGLAVWRWVLDRGIRFLMRNNEHVRSVVFCESPYSGEIGRNVRYLKLAQLDCAARGELAYASHDSMTQHPAKAGSMFVSDYDDQWNTFTRDQAIGASNAMRFLTSKTVFYTDLGWSSGMKAARVLCDNLGIPWEERTVDWARIRAFQAPLITPELVHALCTPNMPYKDLLVEGSAIE